MLSGGDPPFLMWSGADQGTVAALVADGLHYQCFVWLNRADWRIEALCKVTHPDGSKSVVFHNMIDAADAAAISTTNDPLDCPKIIAVGTTFVVHWLGATAVDGESVNQWLLYRATMDMTDFDASVGGWESQGSLGLHEPYALYDVCALEGSDTDFLLARALDVDEIRVERYDGFGVLDTDWQEDIAPEIEGRVLAIYGHEADGDVLVTYERTGMGEEEGGALWSWRLAASDGTAEVSDVQTFTVFSFTDPHGPFENTPVLTVTGARWCQVGHCRVAANQVAVVGEAVLIDIITADKPYTHIHHIAYRRLDSTDATRLGNEWWCPHLAMCSKPFAYDNATTASGTQPNVYAVVSYKSIYATSDWEQATIFCVDLNFSRWAAEDSGQQLRPRMVATLQSVGIPDARISGWHPEDEDADLTDPAPLNGPVKRVNHISGVALPPPYGPQIKTRTVAVGIWARMASVGTDPTDVGTDQSAEAYTDAEIDPVTGEPTIPTTIDVRPGELQPENAGVSGFVIHLEDPWTIFRDSTDPTQPVDNFAGSYPRSACQSVEVGRGLAIFGGTPAYYDGERVGEIGFPWGPEIILLATGEDENGEVEGGGLTYRYYAVATRRDAQGTVHRSRPSRVASVVLPGANNAISIRIRTCTLSLWEHDVFYPTASRTNFEVFRTEGDGAVFYRLYGARAGLGGMMPSDTPTNNPLAIWGYVDFEDTLSSAELVTQGAAPFTLGDGGFIEVTPQTVPALTCPATWQGRLWGADAVDPSLLWYSDEILPEFASDYYRAPEFNDANTFRIDGIGDVTSLRPMGDAMWISTSTGWYALRGNCNDGTGQGADLALEPVHEGIGCVEPRSVVLGPTGVLFQSSKGIHWLDRGGGLDYLTAGASVEDDAIDAGNVRAASIMPNKQQVRVACNGRPITTYTTTWEVSQDTFGATFSITLTGLGAPGLIAETENADGDTDTEIATRLVEQIAALLAVRSSGLHLLIASVSVTGDDVRIVWQPDVVPSYTDEPDGPGNSLVGVDTSSMQVQPRVLVLDMLQKRWSRFDLPDVSSTERLNEVVGGCVWDGCYVVLHQGGLRIERKPGDALEFTDDSSAGAPLPVRIDVKLAPIHFAGLAGVTRVRRLFIQTSKPNVSEFHVDLDYYWSGDYSVPDAIDEEITVDTVTPAGLEVCPRYQKINAIAPRIYEPVGVVNEENVVLHSITLLVGVKKGLSKRSDAMRGTV